MTLNPGLGFRVSGFEKVEGLRIYRGYLLQIQIPPTFSFQEGFGLRVTGFWFLVSGFGFQVSKRLGFSDVEEVPD